MFSKLSSETELYLKNLAIKTKILNEQNIQILKLKDENLKLNSQLDKYRITKKTFKENRDFYSLKRRSKAYVKNNMQRVFKSLNDDLSAYGIRIPKVQISPLDQEIDNNVEIAETLSENACQMDP